MYRLAVIILACCMVLSSLGCQSLRKKFVRKKKYRKDPPVYVDFKDYNNRPTKEAYMNYHVFVRGWLDELIEALRKGMSWKRQKKAVTEALMNFDQIRSFLTEEGKEKTEPLYHEFLLVQKQINQAPNFSETKRNFLMKKVEGLRRDFEANCKYSDLENYLVL